MSASADPPPDGGVGYVTARHYLTQHIIKVILQKSILTQYHQLIFHVSNHKGYVDGFMGKLNSAIRLCKTLCVRYDSAPTRFVVEGSGSKV